MNPRPAGRQARATLLRVTARGSRALPEQFVTSLHGLLRPSACFDREPRVSLELEWRNGEIRFLIWVPTRDRAAIESQLRAVYPELELAATAENGWRCGCVGVVEVRLAQQSYLPIRTAFDGEPLANLLWALAAMPMTHEVNVQILIRPKSSQWQVDAHRDAQRLRDGRRGWESLLPGAPTQVAPNQFETTRAKAIDEKASNVGF